MIPSKKQWQQWSLPSKYTAIGLLLAIVGLLFSLSQGVEDYGKDELISEIKTEIKDAYIDIKNKNDIKNAYVDRYLKERIAEILDVKVLFNENKPSARLYYESYWEGLTSSFSASAEIRRIQNLNKDFAEDKRWEAATLLNKGGFRDDVFYLGESEYITIEGLFYGGIYEVRIVDHSYDSDEPPSLPFKFKVDERK